MNIEVTEQFNKDISKLKDKKLIGSVKKALQKIESASSLTAIPQLKKIEGSRHHFRLRIGDYRMGLYFENNKMYAARLLHRKEIYRFFP
jgi:mRNA interferase RelE/StbE